MPMPVSLATMRSIRLRLSRTIRSCGRSIPALVRAAHALEYHHLRRRHIDLRRTLLQLGIAAHEDVQEDEIGVVHHLDVVAGDAVDLDQAEQRLAQLRRSHVVLPELAGAGQREVEEPSRGSFDYTFWRHGSRPSRNAGHSTTGAGRRRSWPGQPRHGVAASVDAVMVPPKRTVLPTPTAPV